MTISYTQAKSGLDDIARRTELARGRLERAREQIAAAEADLTTLQSEYTSFVSEIDAKSLEAGSALWGLAKAEKDALVTDFQSMKTRAASLKSAFDSVV